MAISGFFSSWLEQHVPVWLGRLLWFWSRLVRTRVIGLGQIEQFSEVCFAHWHGDELALLPRFGHVGLTILVSRSKDGEIMARGARALGYRVTRGSSSRGAVGGLLALIKAVREGHHVVLAVDGPKGPRGVCKPGIVRVAQKTGVPLFPAGVAVSHKFVFKKAWNKAYLPLPFSRQVFFLDEPLYFSQGSAPEEMESNCHKVEEALERAREKAERILACWE